MSNRIYLHPGSTMMTDYLTEAFGNQITTEVCDNIQGVLYFPSAGSGEITDREAAEAIQEGVAELLRLFSSSPHAPWLVFGSSYHVYGSSEGKGIAEIQPAGIPNDAGRAFRQAEETLSRKWPGKLLILRCAPIFGQGDMEQWIMRMFDQVMRGLYFNIRECDSQRSVVLAHDVARLAALLAGENGLYNVADGFDRTLSALATAMGNNHGKGKRPFTIPQKWARIISSTIGKTGLILSEEELIFRSTDLTFSADKLMQHLTDTSRVFSFHDTVAVVGRQDNTYPYREI